LTIRADQLKGQVKSWALPGGTATTEVPVPAHGQGRYPIRYADFLDGGRVVVSLSASDARCLNFTAADTGQPASPPLTTTNPILTLAADPSGKWMTWAELVNEEEVAVYWREGATGANHGPVTLSAKRVRALTFDSVREHIAVIALEGRPPIPDKLIVIDTSGRTEPVEVARGPLMFGGLAFSPTDGTLAVTVNGRTHLYDPNGWQLRSSFSCAETTTSIVFSPDGRRLATVGYDGVVHIAATASGTRILQLRGLAPARPNDVACDARVMFSPDGSWLAASNWDGSLTLWSALPRRSPAIK
jgi:WD40 repeat protein